MWGASGTLFSPLCPPRVPSPLKSWHQRRYWIQIQRSPILCRKKGSVLHPRGSVPNGQDKVTLKEWHPSLLGSSKRGWPCGSCAWRFWRLPWSGLALTE